MEITTIAGKVHLIMEEKEFQLVKRLLTSIKENLSPEDLDAAEEIREQLLM